MAFGVAKVVLCLWLGALGADSDDYEGLGDMHNNQNDQNDKLLIRMVKSVRNS